MTDLARRETTAEWFARHAANPVRSLRLARDIAAAATARASNCWAEAQFERQTAALYRAIVRPKAPHGLAAFLHCGFRRETGIYGLLMHALARRGWMPVNLQQSPKLAPSGDPEIAELDGSLARQSRLDYRYCRRNGETAPVNDWTVDLDRGVCVGDGIDYFPVVMGKLRRIFRSYTLDFSDPDVAQAADRCVRSADAALSAAKALHGIARRRGVPVRIVGAEHVYVPSGVLWLYANAHKDDGMAFVDVGDSYAHYFTAGEYLDDDVMSVANLTRTGAVSRHVVPRDRFEAWLGERTAEDVTNARARVERLIRQDWTGNSAGRSSAAEQVFTRVLRHRAKGRPVACLFGHLAFDLGVPRDHGPAHRDMVDWLNDTVATLNGTGTLLLLKPHVVEGRYKPSREPRQRLSDLLEVEPRENVVLLDPLWFNAYELFPHIDVGLVWRSNAAIELTVAGRPAVVCGTEATYRSALDLVYPPTREAYHALLRDTGSVAVPTDQRDRAAMYLCYLETEQFLRLPYIAKPRMGHNAGYAWRRGIAQWRKGPLDDYLSRGDPNIERICDEIVS